MDPYRSGEDTSLLSWVRVRQIPLHIVNGAKFELFEVYSLTMCAESWIRRKQHVSEGRFRFINNAQIFIYNPPAIVFAHIFT